MADTIVIGELEISVDRKAIKNIHLSVYPPDGRVHLSAPERFDLDALRVYTIGRLDWIEKQQRELRGQARETPREYINRESHYFGGQRYLLRIEEEAGSKARISTGGKELLMQVPLNCTTEQRRGLLYTHYRNHLKSAVPSLITHYEKLMGVSVAEFRIRRMKTKWGSCNIEARRIWLNLELARKPPECLEYLVVHEMVHLLERKHSNRFAQLMDRYLPSWRGSRELLNRLPVAHVDWDY